MGFDISYHPISTDEINKWYFDVLRDPSKVDVLGKEYNIDEFYIEKYKETIKTALDVYITENFDVTHGYFIAVVQGFFRKYYYTRGSAFSFLIEKHQQFTKYVSKWGDIIPSNYTNPRNERIITNYSSGIYISSEKVKQLLSDYKTNIEINSLLTEFYSDNRINVFITALKDASENNLGLLEATEVIEPNPLDLNQSVCYSDLFNCDIEGALLYREKALEQICEIEEDNDMPKDEILNNSAYQRTNIDSHNKESKKVSVWKRLFRK